MNAFVADERRSSPMLALQQEKLVNAARKVADRGKDEVVVPAILFFSANNGECVTKSLIVPVLKFQSDMKFLSNTKFPFATKFSSDVLTLNDTLFKATNSGIVASEKSAICVQMGEWGHTYVKDTTFRK